MNNDTVIDALPYYDIDYEEKSSINRAFALIEEETRRYRPTKNYLEHLGSADMHSFETDIMKNEFERLSNRIQMETLDMRRCEMPSPLPGKTTDIVSWSDCVNNACSQLEHQNIRLINLTNLYTFGTDAWKHHIDILQVLFDRTQKYLLNIRREIQDINSQRQKEQIEGGKRLTELENIWVGLVSKNYEIECALVELEKQLYENL